MTVDPLNWSVAIVDKDGRPTPEFIRKFNAQRTTNNTTASDIASVQTSLAGKVAKAGDTMTGPLVLPGDPVSSLDAATKNYVDTHTGAGAFTSLTDAPHSYTGAAGLYVTVNSGQTGLQFSSPPAETFLGLTDTPASYTGAAGKVVTVNATANGLQFSIIGVLPAGGTAAQALLKNSSTDFDAGWATLLPSSVGLGNVTNVAQVAKAGDTMTGLLTLSGDPTAALGAATKQYVDARAVANLADVLLTALTDSQLIRYNATAGKWENVSVPPATASGTWTPGLRFGGNFSGITYASQSGSYVQIGSLVFINGQIALSSKGTSTGIAQIVNLPIPSNGISNPLVAGYYAGVSGNSGGLFLELNAAATDHISIVAGASGSALNFTDANFTDTTRIDFAGVYIAATPVPIF